MGKAKDIILKPVSAKIANALVKRVHYSGKVDPRSQLHIGVYYHGRLEGAMQFGPSINKHASRNLVRDTPWNGWLELNRMAFTDALPRNSESRAIGIAMKILKRYKPSVEWVVSYADATQCGDGAIYRASGFMLTGIKKNTTIWRCASGEIIADNVTRMRGHAVRDRIGMMPGERWSAFVKRGGAVPLPGFQLRYIYFLDPTARERLTVPIIPFSEIEKRGALMYRGEKMRAGSIVSDAAAIHAEEGGATPTPALQKVNECVC